MDGRNLTVAAAVALGGAVTLAAALAIHRRMSSAPDDSSLRHHGDSSSATAVSNATSDILFHAPLRHRAAPASGPDTIFLTGLTRDVGEDEVLALLSCVARPAEVDLSERRYLGRAWARYEDGGHAAGAGGTASRTASDSVSESESGSRSGTESRSVPAAVVARATVARLHHRPCHGASLCARVEMGMDRRTGLRMTSPQASHNTVIRKVGPRRGQGHNKKGGSGKGSGKGSGSGSGSGSGGVGMEMAQKRRKQKGKYNQGKKAAGGDGSGGGGGSGGKDAPSAAAKTGKDGDMLVHYSHKALLVGETE